jgi:hypothetical protein
MARPGLVFDVMMIILDQQAVLDFSKASSLNNPWIDMFIEPMICPTRGHMLICQTFVTLFTRTLVTFKWK